MIRLRNWKDEESEQIMEGRRKRPSTLRLGKETPVGKYRDRAHLQGTRKIVDAKPGVGQGEQAGDECRIRCRPAEIRKHCQGHGDEHITAVSFITLT